MPRRHQLVLSRGPYRYDDEFALLREHRIDALVTKNSGGDMTRAKLDAAAALDIPVVMVARPPLPAGVTAVGTVQEAADWVAEARTSRSGRRVSRRAASSASRARATRDRMVPTGQPHTAAASA